MFSICNMTTSLKVCVNLLLETLLSPHFSILGNQWSSASGNVKYLFFHMTSPNQVTGGSCNVISGVPHGISPPLPSLIAMGIVLVQIEWFQFVT